MTDIGIVGAGAGASAAAFVVANAAPDANVTIFEKSGGLCGRAATRRHDDLTYDYGANYLKSDDERVVDVITETLDTEGLVDVTEPIHTFEADGEVTPGRDADEHKWSYRRGLTQIAKRLLDRTDATVHRRTRVETIRRIEGDSDGGSGDSDSDGGGDGSGDNRDAGGDGRWELVDADGETWGPFDVLLLNPPAPQTADLLRDAEWESPLRERLVDAVGDVEYRTVWSAVLHYPFAIDVPYYAVVNTDKEHAIGWISREECKAGHVPDGETLLIVQANHEWSVEHYDDDPAANVSALAEHAADIMDDDRLGDPAWTDHQGWRYAQPEAGVARGPLDSAQKADLYLLGDWVAGEGRLHAAIANGLDVGEKVVYGL